MRRIMACLLMAGGSMAFGQTKAAPAKADPAGIEQTLKQLEREWTEAGIKKDAKTLDRIMANDWVALDFLGKTITKAQALADLKSGASASQSVDLGELKVRVFGNTAVVTGSDTEKSTYNGKDSSGKYVWTDVFVKRNGRWQAVASHSTKIDK